MILKLLTYFRETPKTPNNNSLFSSLIAELSQLTSHSDHRALDFGQQAAATTLSDSREGFYSVTSSGCSSRSLGSQTDNMSDLIITTGHEDLYQETGSVISAWNSTVSGSGARAGIMQEVQQWSYNQPSDDLASSHTPTNATVSSAIDGFSILY